MAPLCYAAKLDPPPLHPGAIQGIKFCHLATLRPGRRRGGRGRHRLRRQRRRDSESVEGGADGVPAASLELCDGVDARQEEQQVGGQVGRVGAAATQDEGEVGLL